MLKEIKIKNYKLFKEFTLKKLPRVFLIGGKNNCGKTTVLESIFLPLDCANPAMFMNHLNWRGLHSLSNNAESLFSPAYHNFNLKQPIEFEYTINSSEKKIAYKFLPAKEVSFVVSEKTDSVELQKPSEMGGIEISCRLSKDGKDGFYKTILKYIQTGIHLSDKKQQLLRYNENTKCTFVPSNMSSRQEEHARMYSKLDITKSGFNIVEALRIIEPKLKSLSVILSGNVPVLYGDVGIEKKIPLALMGQGMDKLVSILLHISDIKNGIILVDELENGFHYSLMPRIWEIIATYTKANNAQIIATTHSRELIMSAVKGIPTGLKDEFKYLRIERKDDQFTNKEYNIENLSAALDANLAIR